MKTSTSKSTSFFVQKSVENNKNNKNKNKKRALLKLQLIKSFHSEIELQEKYAKNGVESIR